MLKELNTNKQLAPLVAQIVPIKIKVGTDMYRQWSQQHKHEGRGIPIVYIVRADGKTLYAKSGKPKTESLGQMLLAALDDAGYIMTEKDISAVQKVTADFQKFRDNGDIAAAVKSLRKAKNYLDENGNVASYSESATALQNEIDKLIETASTAIDKSKTAIEQLNSEDSQILEALELFDETKQKYGPVKPLKPKLAEIQSLISKNPTLKKNQVGLKTLRAAEVAKTKSQKERAVKRLKTLIADPPSQPVLNRAKKELRRLQKTTQNPQ